MLEIHNFTQNEINEDFLKKTAEQVLKKVAIKEKTEISLAIVGESRIRRLNKIYRGKNRVTDVLSFGDKTIIPFLKNIGPKQKEYFIEPPDKVNRLGEIVICYPRAKKQARLANHSLKKELTILLIHGILHLLGYDHEKNEQEAERMRKMEKEILSDLNNQ